MQGSHGRLQVSLYFGNRLFGICLSIKQLQIHLQMPLAGSGNGRPGRRTFWVEFPASRPSRNRRSWPPGGGGAEILLVAGRGGTGDPRLPFRHMAAPSQAPPSRGWHVALHHPAPLQTLTSRIETPVPGKSDANRKVGKQNRPILFTDGGLGVSSLPFFTETTDTFQVRVRGKQS